MQDDLDALTQINDSADKASNTFRRLMLALAEYRRPPRAGDTFSAIQQANIAGQQVVQNCKSEKSKSENPTNEQGCTDDSNLRPESAKALPAHVGGTAITLPSGPAHEAVAPQHRATNTGG